jgi:hypothetical protein
VIQLEGDMLPIQGGGVFAIRVSYISGHLRHSHATDSLPMDLWESYRPIKPLYIRVSYLRLYLIALGIVERVSAERKGRPKGF